MLNIKIFSVAVVLVCAASAFAQQSEATSPRPPLQALSAACDGAWQEVDDAIASLQKMPQTALSHEHRARVVCLLQTIGQTTFDSRDAQFNALMATTAAELVVKAYGPAAYDFFAEQLGSDVSHSVRRGVQGVLLASGHPDAFRLYFAERREKLTRNETWDRENPAAASIFEPLIAKGTCREGFCSNRIPETLQIIAGNIDILDLELQATESFRAPSKTDESEAQAKHIREAARSLRSLVGRINRGEAVIGAAPR